MDHGRSWQTDGWSVD